jgi:hypothetical protein
VPRNAVSGPFQGFGVPRDQLSGILRRRAESLSAHSVTGGDDGCHPHEDAAGVADQAGGVPFGAVRHRPSPIGLGGSEQRATVDGGRSQER